MTLTHTNQHRGLAAEPIASVTVIPWRDQLVEVHPESTATASNETLVWWTPTLGPTATLMAHRFAGYMKLHQEAKFTMADLAAMFGMGESMTRIRVAFERLERFGVIRVDGQTVSVRMSLGPLSEKQIERLPACLADLYRARRYEIVRAR